MTTNQKDVLSSDELQIIAKTHFSDLVGAQICVGVRWLFTKKTIAKERLHHTATWDDAVAEYKGILDAIVKNEDPNHNPDPDNEMPKFRFFYKQLTE